MRAWFSFLWMAPAELRVPLGTALAAAALLLVMLFAWDLPRWTLLAPGAAFLGAIFWGWTRCYLRLQALEDVPLSKIASAAQGYTRLEGHAAAFPGKPLLAPVKSEPCCWYSYRAVTYDGRGEVTSSEEETTDWSFMMTDGSAECVVDPTGARIVPVRVNRFRDKDQSWTEHVILPGDALCVIGDFTTSSGDVNQLETNYRVGELIAERKKDMRWLRQRFAPAHGGEFSEAEWDAVRAQARREVYADLARDPPRPLHPIHQPADQRPFLLSAESRPQLVRDFTIWSWLHVLGFIGGVACLAALYLRYF